MDALPANLKQRTERGSSRWIPSVSIMKRIATVVVVANLLGACAGTPTRPARPEVTVVGVRPVSLSSNEQRFLFRLRLKNPNDFSLPIDKVDFTATIAGVEVAEGQSKEGVDVKSRGQADLDIEVVTHVTDIFHRFLKNLRGEGINLGYRLKGDIWLKNRSTSFPFNTTGNLLDGLDL